MSSSRSIAILRRALSNIGIDVRRAGAVSALQQKLEQQSLELKVVQESLRKHSVLHRARSGIADDGRLGAVDLVELSPSQLGQDLFALATVGFKQAGFFVEMGATDGVSLSNSYLLEAKFGWDGILAEPARCWHESLRRNRRAQVDTRCVWSESGRLVEFRETNTAEFSTVDILADSDHHGDERTSGSTYLVETVSLNDLLDERRAPRDMDYLSLDTEGSELEILSGLDLSRWQFRVITCEHNYSGNREQIHDLLAANGYVRRCTDLSMWDDWYVLAE